MLEKQIEQSGSAQGMGALQFGIIAKKYGNKELPLKVFDSLSGFFIGTADDEPIMDGLPFSRESEEFFTTRKLAQEALDTGKWTQRQKP